MLKYFEVSGLNGKENYFNTEFHEDVNIITGKNGAGKTTVMKLIWYLYSGNLRRAVEEVKFNSVKLITTQCEIIMNKVERTSKYPNLEESLYIENEREIERRGGKNIKRKPVLEHPDYNIKFLPSSISENFRPVKCRLSDNDFIEELEKLICTFNEKSIFFPTFRRIEGGFSTKENRNKFLFMENRLQDAVKNVSEEISKEEHLFITSISTIDIVDLITKEYASVSENVNKQYIRTSRYIESQINRHSLLSDKSRVELLNEANSLLTDIKQTIRENSYYRERMFKPFDILNEMIKEIFQYKGIVVTDNVTLGIGETKEAMLSENLSAGEKQMLSFICYNAFYRENAIFIDEPEISLHVDWQRTLIPTLMYQEAGNQYIIATHSPFIYSKYADKEIMLNPDRGGW